MHASLCDFLSDIVQNAIESGASLITVDMREDERSIACTVTDNGKGMSGEVQRKVTDPFYTDGIKHKGRTVGLGIPFLIQAVDAVDGDFTLKSQEGEGTTVAYRFPLQHIDCPPLGNVVSTLVSMLAFPGTYDMVVTRSLELPAGCDGYELERHVLIELLGDFALGGTLNMLRTYVQSQEAALDEIRNRRT
ncbi:MAG: ATP-binding protein [Spirochaetae bacterium HGW-Spirochaetae-2]|jgi:hypothetical protein|nr:MAG: ATP-binding protein [Spirochaetae bacterium HGW-Spirochaetae-2]